MGSPSGKEEKAEGTDKSSKKAAEDNEAEEVNKDGSSGKDEAKIINNITHIDQKGANINITNINNHQTFVIYANR